ncbi:MAG: hypothetical protein PHW74_07545 [Desulfobacca sp.]|nr:hypothetical protein [Desulfobacca sp.]
MSDAKNKELGFERVWSPLDIPILYILVKGYGMVEGAGGAIFEG